MDGQLLPVGFARLEPFLRNLTENVAAVQFDHRLLAMLTVFAVAITLVVGLTVSPLPAVRIPLLALGVAVALQYLLGVTALLLVVPIGLAAAHQAMAVLVLTACTILLHALRRPAT